MTAKAQIEIMIRARFPDVVAEYKFHPVRRWRFDWALPDLKIAFEFEGGVFVGGRHGRGIGMSLDCEKYNTAQLMGWRVFRFTAAHVSCNSKDMKYRRSRRSAGHAKEILEGI